MQSVAQTVRERGEINSKHVPILPFSIHLTSNAFYVCISSKGIKLNASKMPNSQSLYPNLHYANPMLESCFPSNSSIPLIVQFYASQCTLSLCCNKCNLLLSSPSPICACAGGCNGVNPILENGFLLRKPGPWCLCVSACECECEFECE